MDPSAVSLVVPVGGAAPHWPRAARSFERLDPPPGEIVVVADGVALDAATLPAGATVVQLERRGGPARARNHGVEAARGELVFFLDSDVEAPSDLIARVSSCFAPRTDEPLPSAVIGSYDAAPGAPGFVSQYRNLLHHIVHQTSAEQASTFWSGCGAVRRAAFLAVGGFDEGYADPSIEDIELGARLLRGGHRIRLVKDLQVKHLKRWTFGQMVHTDLFRRAVPWTEQMLGADGLIDDLNVKTRDRLAVVCAFLAVAALVVPVCAGALRRRAVTVSCTLVTACLLAIVGLCRDIFGFFLRARGLLFTLGVLPLYWLYLLICGLGFALGLARHSGRQLLKRVT
ncbi:MAG: glycosyltransferase family 2 protein [Acidobacteriota bacterium]